ncbi:related to Mx2 protein (GTPase protein) [Rhynchosporium agropyri]|uniref:Related to Mx2 protein (GTPase protein) n=1 Tax=Rhynchosporium agropyri TaxID=914238 RepID=A0A1E1KMP6_9HELO|nr:related to Mx2 protein (GTPase protein) [Rhynchosporium agropyri]
MVMEELGNTSSLEDLQTDEQRRILDMVVQVRKCGLDDNLSLPQLVVCGDQSAGKSSVLEALTEIPFPRSDNLCTRFATEISLRRANTESLTIKVNPDSSRPTSEQETIKKFEESITDFSQLPKIVDLAMAVMGIAKGSNGEAQARAFARDVLSIEISGPKRPQLTLVDIPGLIATSTKGVTKADVDTVTEITDYYISQPRTICLAVVSATNDYANQKILDKVRDVDPNGDRTLGIITKPDGLAHGSGSERAYIDLAQNEDIFFKLGWHVLKNRKFEETSFSIAERNLSEKAFFRKSNFKTLSAETVGIESLRRRLSLLLFEHIKRELPKLREDLEEQLETTKESLSQMGTRRSTAAECSAYLSQSSLDFHETCKAAINGHYEGRYFQKSIDSSFSTESVSTACRARAVVQSMNMEFAETMRLKGHKYQVDLSDDEDSSSVEDDSITSGSNQVKKSGPQVLSKGEALEWVEKAIERTRGKELIGSYNPLLIGELFWEQSSAWNKLALAHVESVARVCSRFLKQLLKDNYPKDVEARIWSFKIEEELKARNRKAIDELEKVINDLRNYPINYNHYYTDTITKRRLDRQKAAFEKSIKEASADGHDFSTRKAVTNIDMPRAMNIYSKRIDPDMNKFSCEEALDSLFAIYKVMQKTFIANVTTQVIERHIVHGLELIFSPVVVNSLEPAQAEALASEPKSSKRKREHLVEQIKKLEEGHEIFKSVM